MHWLLTTHVRRYKRHYHSSGHIWQGRFKAFPVQEDDHLRVVLRYMGRLGVWAAFGGRLGVWAALGSDRGPLGVGPLGGRLGGRLGV